jgi:hypothetical protein
MKTIKIVVLSGFILTIAMLWQHSDGIHSNKKKLVQVKITNQVDPMKTLAKHGYISIEDSIFSYDYVRGSLNTELLKSLAKISEDYPVVQMQPYSKQ